jgi:hypothetical protein
MIRIIRVCRKCGANIFSDAPEALCARCVLKSALGGLTGASVAGVDSSAVAAYSAEAAAKAGSAKAGPPQRAADWICGQPLAFLIDINGQRIYIDSGGTPAQLPPNEHVDLAILGMALPDSRARLPAALERLQPRYVLPSHQDNFFRPLNAGFQFGPLTDFPRVQRDCARASRSRLILLDYFRPWTLPAAVNPKSQAPNPKQHGTNSQPSNGR